MVHAVATTLTPAFEELIRQAAQGEVLHNDDTTVKILELMGAAGRQEALASAATDEDNAEQRTGLFTSGVVALRDGRRVALFFSDRLLEVLAVVYRNDTIARERQLSPEARLQFHQQESRPTMQLLHEWLRGQLEEKLTEPNSTLGGAIKYVLRHWEKLTLFLRQASAPLDNNVCEAP